MTARDPDALTEAQFQRQVTDLAAILGFWHVHFRAGRTAHGWAVPVSGPLGAGWPDLFLVRERDRRAIFVELKSATGKLTDDQRRVLGVLREAGFEVYVFWPHQLDEAYEILNRDGSKPAESGRAI